MSISVDDLASSFSSSHIGQEAIDLAALQAQLAQTLFGQSVSQSSKGARQVSRRKSYTQPCNTPTASALGFNWGDVQRQGGAGSGSSWNVEMMYDNRSDMEEDERMVEDLLVPSSPMSTNPNSPPFSAPLSGSATQYNPYTTAEYESPSSSFTSADPFYLAQAQAAQNYNAASQSVFSQYGRPPQQSPFVTSPQQQQPISQHHESFHCRPTPPHLSLDTHALFAATAATFNI